jgi:hypothetical protein
MNLVAANHYELEGTVSGTVDTSSFGGGPAVSVQVFGTVVQDAQLRESDNGLEVTGFLSARPDLDSQQLLLVLPRVNIEQDAVVFSGVALVVTTRTSIAGTRLVNGAVQSYEIHPVAGRASVVDF